MNKFHIAAAALLIASCDAQNDSAEPGAVDSGSQNNSSASSPYLPTNASDAAAQPTDAAGYVKIAAAADMWEIESSKAVLNKTKNTDIKRLAQMIVDHHSQSSKKLSTAAKSANIAMATPMLAADQQAMLTEIQRAPAENVDSIYLRHQHAAHAKALSLHQGYMRNGDNALLKPIATEIVPVIQQHIAELDKMARTPSNSKQ
jgi:putative membrane protein